jgi:hypothetical protein
VPLLTSCIKSNKETQQGHNEQAPSHNVGSTLLTMVAAVTAVTRALSDFAVLLTVDGMLNQFAALASDQAPGCCCVPSCCCCELVCSQFDIRDTIAGVCGSLACVYVGNPFDVAKTRMQTRPDAFTGLLDCFVQTFKKEGVRAYWKGSSAAAISAMTENAVVRRYASGGFGASPIPLPATLLQPPLRRPAPVCLNREVNAVVVALVSACAVLTSSMRAVCAGVHSERCVEAVVEPNLRHTSGPAVCGGALVHWRLVRRNVCHRHLSPRGEELLACAPQAGRGVGQRRVGQRVEVWA